MNIKNKKSFSLSYQVSIVLTVILLVSLSVGLSMSLRSGRIVNKKVAEAKEISRPGNIEIISIVDPACDSCFKLTSLTDAIKKYNVKPTREEEISIDSEEAKGLISKFGITKVPALIVRGEINKDKKIEEIWKAVGKVEGDTFVLTQNGAPYVLLETREVKGQIKLTMLTDNSCKDCYQVGLHERILGGFGVTNKEKNLIDVSSDEGKEVVSKYNIKFLPTIILEGDLEAYPKIVQVWPEVGSVEDGGVYVFRQGVKQMGTYKDLNTGKVVIPAPVKK